MATDLTAAQWKTLTATVLDELGRWYEPRSADLAPAGRKITADALSRGGLRGGVQVRHLFEPAVLLAPTEPLERMFQLGDICRQVPFTGNYGIWEPIRATFATITRRCLMAGDSRSAMYEQLVCWPENGERPGPIVLTPPAVNRTNGLIVERLRSDFSPPLRRQEFSHIIERIRELTVMWVLGGSERWPRRRIDVELDQMALLVRAYLMHQP